MKLGSETGSVMNHVYARYSKVPAIGMGCTILMWTDRHAATIIRISDSGKTVWFQEDESERIDNNGMSEDQEYKYTPNQKAPIKSARLGKKGWRIKGGGTLMIGERREYYDYSF